MSAAPNIGAEASVASNTICCQGWTEATEEQAREFLRMQCRAPTSSDLSRLLVRRFEKGVEDRVRRGGRLIRASPIAKCWDAVARWKLMLVHQWRRQEHINILEAPMIVTLGKALARSGEGVGKCTLVMTDSLVALGLFGKGRSSVRALLRLARKMMVLRMFRGVRLVLRHVETLRNMSDGPTRGQPIGEKTT